MNIKRILKGAGIRSSYGTMGAAGVVLIEDTRRILVDVGHFGIRDPLLREMNRAGVQCKDIDTVVLTHLNWDHCFNVDLFPNAQIIVGVDEMEKGTLSGVPDGITPAFKSYLSSLNVLTVSDGYKITPNVSIVYTPGHTPGHVAVSAKDGHSHTIMTGDAIPNLRAYRRGMPDLAFYNEAMARESVSKIKSLKPDLIIPGHDAPFTDQGYAELDSVDIILREEQEVNTVLTFGKTASDSPVVFNA